MTDHKPDIADERGAEAIYEEYEECKRLSALIEWPIKGETVSQSDPNLNMVTRQIEKIAHSLERFIGISLKLAMSVCDRCCRPAAFFDDEEVIPFGLVRGCRFCGNDCGVRSFTSWSQSRRLFSVGLVRLMKTLQRHQDTFGQTGIEASDNSSIQPFENMHL